jgi:hypothetical protein
MKILESPIDNLSRIEIKNGLLHVTVGNRLHTEKVDASKYSPVVWQNGLAYFTVFTTLGDVDVEASALEWEATRTTPAPPTTVVGVIKNFLTGGNCCTGF